MLAAIGVTEVIIVVVVLVVLFGAKRLPDLARAIGRSGKELREGFRDDDDDPPAEGS